MIKPDKKTRASIMLILAVLIVSIAVYQIFGDFFLFKTYDIFESKIGGKKEKPHKDVVMLLIDEASLEYGEKIGLGRWPWTRNVYPEIINYINLTSPPKGIFFDILFPESDLGEGNDVLFSESIAANRNVYQNMLITKVKAREEGELNPMPPDIKKNFSIHVKNPENISFQYNKGNDYVLPIPCLRSEMSCDVQDVVLEDLDTAIGKNLTAILQKARPAAKGITVASFDPESDGVYRKGRILFKYGGQYYPSMALSAIMAYTGEKEVEIAPDNIIKVGNLEIPVGDDGKYLVNYYKEKNRIPAYRMSALMLSAYYLANGEDDKLVIHPDEFKDKIVIVGVSAVGGGDLKNTPIHGKFPGPEINANIISNILQGNHIEYENSILTYIILILIIILLAVSILFISSNLIKIIILLGLLSGYTVVNILLFRSYNYLSPVLFILFTGILSGGVSFIYLSMTEGAEKRKYSKILGNMIDPGIVTEALKDLDSLKKGGEKNITAFFSDIASFSTISEKLTSQNLAALLNEYLSEMTIILKHYGGTLDKYIGDAVVGIFGAPVDLPDNALPAARASLEMLDRLAALRKKWTGGNEYCSEAQNMRVRIGLNTGMAKVGFMGTENLASYTMMGDTVNLAARLEAAGKDYGVSILVSETTKNHIENEMFLRELDAVRVKGKNEPVLIYELIGIKGHVQGNILESVNIYEEAFHLYRERQWDKASEKLKKSREIRGADDKAADLLIERCKLYMNEPPPQDWDGVFTRTHK